MVGKSAPGGKPSKMDGRTEREEFAQLTTSLTSMLTNLCRVVLACGLALALATSQARNRHYPYPSLLAELNAPRLHPGGDQDRKSTRLNSSHLGISYAVFC